VSRCIYNVYVREHAPARYPKERSSRFDSQLVEFLAYEESANTTLNKLKRCAYLLRPLSGLKLSNRGAAFVCLWQIADMSAASPPRAPVLARKHSGK
jgi:hypothetical protein